MPSIRRAIPVFAFFVCFIAVGCVSDAFGQRTFHATLDGAQQVPPVSTQASGTGTVVLNAAETQVTLTLNFSGLGSNQIASHIHSAAPRGGNGGVLINIGATGTTSGSFTVSNVAVTAGEVANLKNGLWYFNVHTNIFGNGEIRGQVGPDCSQLPNGLVSWWQGEGNAQDQNNLSNAALQGGTSFAAGKVGQAFSLDGTNDYIDAGPGFDLNSFTLEAWVFITPATNTGERRIISKDNVLLGPTRKLFSLKSSTVPGGDGRPAFGVTIGVSSDAVTAPTALTAGWHHLAGIRDTAANRFELYVDGVLAAGTTPAVIGPIDSAVNTVIGQVSPTFNSEFFSGLIDEPAIFSRALSQIEIQAIYNADIGGKCPACIGTPVGLISWWSGDGNALDPRNRNNGTLQNGASFAEGKGSHGFVFDGANDFVSVPDSVTLNPITQLTFEAWAYPLTDTHGTDVMQIILNKEDGGTFQYEFARRTSSGCGSGGGIPTGNFAYALDIAGLPNDCSGWVDGGALLPLNTWSHVAVSYDGSNVRSYVNGSLARTLPASGPLPITIGNLRIGGRALPFEQWQGRIDEVSLYGRALSAAEIAAVANTGSACKCKPTATAAPSGLVGWWGGDGYPTDISGSGNNGTLQPAVNGAGFAVSQVGQGFSFDGVDDNVSITNNGNLDFGTGNFSIELWANLNTLSNNQILFHKVSGSGSSVNDPSYFVEYAPPNSLRFRIGEGFLLNFNDLIVNTTLTTGQWFHVTAVRNGDLNQLYLNGSLIGSQTAGTNINTGTGGNTVIGKCLSSGGCFRFVNGKMDEVSLYNRALTPDEITSIFNAGIAGKLKQAVTTFGPPPISKKGPPELGSVPSGIVGDASIFFTGGSGTGFTQSVPVKLSGLPRLPFQSLGLTYDISTSVAFTGSPSVCFSLPSFTPIEFASLRIMHLENENWINRTTATNVYPDLCTTGLPSLSPFAITNLTPTAAHVSVGGRVLTAGGQGISGAKVFMTDVNGATRTAPTSSFGYFRFDDVRAGATYVVEIGSKRFTFAPRIITVSEELTDLEFRSNE